MAIQSIYLVDDDQTSNFLGKMAIEQVVSGSTISTFENGQLALDSILQNGKPDLVLLDFNMPVMNGLQFLEALNANNIDGIDIHLLQTTDFLESDISKMKQLGVNSFITKPLTADKLKPLFS